MLSYLLKNDLQPSISNLYMAQYSGAANGETGVGTSEISDGDFADMEGQISTIIESAGLEVNEETLANSKWLIENQIPFTRSFIKIPFFLREKYRGAHQFYVIHTNRNRYSQARHTLDHMDSVFRRRLIVSNY